MEVCPLRTASELRYLQSWTRIISAESLFQAEIRCTLAREIREKYPDKTIWLYTGSLWEEIQQYEIIHYLDVCVDGEFQVDKKEVRLKWKGSSNQRVIDVQASLRENRVVLYTE